MADRDGGAMNIESQGDIEKLTIRINALQNLAFQVASIYFASQGVVFTAVLTGNKTSLVCRDVWFPSVLSLVPAFVNITALSVIGWNLVNAIGDRHKIMSALPTFHQPNTLQLSPTNLAAAADTNTPAHTSLQPPPTQTLTTTAPAMPLHSPPTQTLNSTAVPGTTTVPTSPPPTQTLTTTATPMPPALPLPTAAVLGTTTTEPGTTAVPTGYLCLKITHTICLCACMSIFAIFTIVVAVGSWWMLCP